MEKEDKIKELEDEVNTLKEELFNTKEHLKKYTAPTRSKTYYENHKEEVINKNKEYKKNMNYVYEVSPEKKKEYARRAYLNKKEKLKKNNEIV
jgi:hypothetical protein